MVPDNSTGIPRVPAYSGADSQCIKISHTGLSPSPVRHSNRFRYLLTSISRRSYNPGTRIATTPVWALPRSLAATGGIVFTFSSCGYLDVSVPHVRSVYNTVTESLPPGCPIRKSTHHRIFAPPRGLSQLITSFIASESQGIPHAPLVDSVLSSYN